MSGGARTKSSKEEYFILRLPEKHAARVHGLIRSRRLGEQLEIELGQDTYLYRIFLSGFDQNVKMNIVFCLTFLCAHRSGSSREMRRISWRRKAQWEGCCMTQRLDVHYLVCIHLLLTRNNVGTHPWMNSPHVTHACVAWKIHFAIMCILHCRWLTLLPAPIVGVLTDNHRDAENVW